MAMGKRRQIVRIVVDILCLGIVFLPVICLKYAAEPYHRGFFCDDESINHPFKDSTISTAVLTIVGVGLPILTFLVIEGLHFSSHRQTGTPDPPYMIGDTPIPFLVYQYYKIIGVFLFGGAFQQAVVNICKYSVGRLRPHFLAVCQPNWSQFNCTDSRREYVYVVRDYCTGNDEEKNTEMRLSFLSGHASFSCYAMLYLAMYLHARMTWKGSKMLCPLLQSIALMMAIYTSLSRISDYKHHWSDVLAGAIVGMITACVSVSKLSRWFSWQRKIRNQVTINDSEYSREDEDYTDIQVFSQGDLSDQDALLVPLDL